MNNLFSCWWTVNTAKNILWKSPAYMRASLWGTHRKQNHWVSGCLLSFTRCWQTVIYKVQELFMFYSLIHTWFSLPLALLNMKSKKQCLTVVLICLPLIISEAEYPFTLTQWCFFICIFLPPFSDQSLHWSKTVCLKYSNERLQWNLVIHSG